MNVVGLKSMRDAHGGDFSSPSGRSFKGMTISPFHRKGGDSIGTMGPDATGKVTENYQYIAGESRSQAN